MKALTARHRFTRAGISTYHVHLLDPTEVVEPQLLGTLWRTRDGWRYSLEGQRTVATYGVSRGVAAGLLETAATADIQTLVLEDRVVYVWHGHMRGSLAQAIAYRARMAQLHATQAELEAQAKALGLNDDEDGDN